MSQTQPEKKNRFSVSREVQTEFVEKMAKTMLELTETITTGVKPVPVPAPFCPVTGHAYGGASMTRLMLAGMEKAFTDDRWLTFNQLQQYKAQTKDFKPSVRKGEHGVKLLRSEEVKFIVDEKSGKWEFLSEEREKELRQMGKNGPKIQSKTLFYPYVVFNASQIDGFPPRENPAPAISPEERNALIDHFVACSGLKVEHGHEQPRYDAKTDTIQLPDRDKCSSPDDYYAMKLRLAFHATGTENREKRSMDEFEVMRGETFSLLAGSRLGLPMPADGGSWKDKFEGVENAKAFEAAADASKMLAVLEQFRQGLEPKAKWFPPKEQWPAPETSPSPEQAKPEPAAAPRMRM
jgi:antirestriction protein ArdC